MPKLDIHVLTKDTGVGSLGSLRALLSAEPCNTFYVEFIEGMGKARNVAFSHGSSEYVGCVDDDDLIQPGVFTKLINLLDQNTEAVGAFSDEMLVAFDGSPLRAGRSTGNDWSPIWQFSTLRNLHHVWIGRRSAVEKYLPMVAPLEEYADWALTGLMALDGPWVHLPEVGYYWRQKENQGPKRHSEAMLRARKLVANAWLEGGVVSQEQFQPISEVILGLEKRISP